MKRLYFGFSIIDANIEKNTVNFGIKFFNQYLIYKSKIRFFVKIRHLATYFLAISVAISSSILAIKILEKLGLLLWKKLTNDRLICVQIVYFALNYQLSKF